MGKHLTPDERARIVERYQVLANACAVATEFGVSEYTVRQSVKRAGSTKKNELHARAVERAIRKGRAALARSIEITAAWIERLAGNVDQPGCEPGDVAKLVSAQRQAVSGVCEVAERTERVRQSRLTRKKTRAEIALLEAKARGDVQEVVVLTQQQAAERARVVFGSPSALELGSGETQDGQSDPGAAVVAGDAVPVPDSLDH